MSKTGYSQNATANIVVLVMQSGLFSGHFPDSNIIDYITIASAGNASDFGDLTQNQGSGSFASTLQYGGGFAGS